MGTGGRDSALGEDWGRWRIVEVDLVGRQGGVDALGQVPKVGSRACSPNAAAPRGWPSGGG